MTTICQQPMPQTLLDRIRGGMNAQAKRESKVMLDHCIARTEQYLARLRSMRRAQEDEAEPPLPSITIYEDGSFPPEQIDRLLDSPTAELPTAGLDDTQIVPEDERAADLDDDAHGRFLSSAEIDALKIDAEEFALEPYDPLK